jgi:hypothetical protein
VKTVGLSTGLKQAGDCQTIQNKDNRIKQFPEKGYKVA